MVRIWSQRVGSSERLEERVWSFLSGAGLTGISGVVILLAGLAFTGILLSNRRLSKPIPSFKPINSENEALLCVSGEDNDLLETKADSAIVSSAPFDSNNQVFREVNDSLLCENEESVSCFTGNYIENSIQADRSLESPSENKLDASDNIPTTENVSLSSVDSIIAKENHFLTSDATDILTTENFDSEEKVTSSSYPVAPDFNEVMTISTNATEENEMVSGSQVINVNDIEAVSSWDAVDGKDFRSTENLLHLCDQEMAVESESADNLESSISPSGVPAPFITSPSFHELHAKVLAPALMDLVQGQALAALQTLKVVETDVLPTDICTRREYARWLVAASGTLSRDLQSKVYPAMYIENITELAFDDVTHDDPDFSSIQGLAEAGLISSKLSNLDVVSSANDDQKLVLFQPDSPLCRQDLVCWKMTLERRQLPEPDKNILFKLSGFRDIDRIHPDAWPALIADLSLGNQGIVSLAIGFTRLFQPDKPVTKAQAAVALVMGESSDVVNEELTRIAAESAAENAVMAHNDLVTQVEREINASFEKELLLEKERTLSVEKQFQEAVRELEKLRAEREMSNVALMKERVAIESEIEFLSNQRREYEEQLEILLTNKVEVSYEKERINKLQKEAEIAKEEISRLQYELEVEKKALSMARAWAEDEAKNARDQAKALGEARDRWEKRGLKVVVDDDLREESVVAATGHITERQFTYAETVSRASTLTDKLKLMAEKVTGKSKEVIKTIIHKVLSIVEWLKSLVFRAGKGASELKDSALAKGNELAQEIQSSTARINSAAQEKVRDSLSELQRSTESFSFALKDGTKRAVETSRDGVLKLSQKFRS